MTENLITDFKNNNSDQGEIVRSNNLVIALIGPTGSGKSRVKEVIGKLSNDLNSASFSPTPVTNEFKTDIFSIKRPNHILNIKIMDTIGLGDQFQTTNDIILGIEENLNNNDVNLIILCFKFGSRLIKVLKDGINSMIKRLHESGFKYTNFMIVYTCCDGINSTTLKDYHKLMSAEVKYLNNINNIFFASFPDDTYYLDELKIQMQEISEKSRINFINFIDKERESVRINVQYMNIKKQINKVQNLLIRNINIIMMSIVIFIVLYIPKLLILLSSQEIPDNTIISNGLDFLRKLLNMK